MCLAFKRPSAFAAGRPEGPLPLPPLHPPSLRKTLRRSHSPFQHTTPLTSTGPRPPSSPRRSRHFQKKMVSTMSPFLYSSLLPSLPPHPASFLSPPRLLPDSSISSFMALDRARIVLLLSLASCCSSLSHQPSPSSHARTQKPPHPLPPNVGHLASLHLRGPPPFQQHQP